jgi:hypothetical protein
MEGLGGPFAYPKDWPKRKPKACCFRPALLGERLSGRQSKYSTRGEQRKREIVLIYRSPNG